MTHAFRRFGAQDFTAASWASTAALTALHVAAVASIAWTEWGSFGFGLALLTWLFLNAFWLVLLRRPTISAALSLIVIEALIALSLFKFSILESTIGFLDFLIVDADTVSFLLMIFPELRIAIAIGVVLVVPLLILLWRLDPFRVPRSPVLTGGTTCLAAMIAVASAVPERPWEPFGGTNHVSNFTRSGVFSVAELLSHGWFEAAATVDPSACAVTRRGMPASGQTTAHHHAARRVRALTLPQPLASRCRPVTETISVRSMARSGGFWPS